MVRVYHYMVRKEPFYHVFSTEPLGVDYVIDEYLKFMPRDDLMNLNFSIRYSVGRNEEFVILAGYDVYDLPIDAGKGVIGRYFIGRNTSFNYVGNAITPLSNDVIKEILRYKRERVAVEWYLFRHPALSSPSPITTTLLDRAVEKIKEGECEPFNIGYAYHIRCVNSSGIDPMKYRGDIEISDLYYLDYEIPDEYAFLKDVVFREAYAIKFTSLDRIEVLKTFREVPMSFDEFMNAPITLKLPIRNHETPLNMLFDFMKENDPRDTPCGAVYNIILGIIAMFTVKEALEVDEHDYEYIRKYTDCLLKYYSREPVKLDCTKAFSNLVYPRSYEDKDFLEYRRTMSQLEAVANYFDCTLKDGVLYVKHKEGTPQEAIQLVKSTIGNRDYPPQVVIE